jgi:hypothetical protein
MFLERSESQATKERVGRRAPSPPAAAPLSSLQALNAAAGNAAATQAVQRARGNRPDTVGNAELTRAVQRAVHEHGPGCAHDLIDVQRRVEGEPALQRPSAFFAAQRTPGRPLASHVQRRVEQAYGMPFGHVRVHDDPVSQQSAVEMGASAYTSGSDIYIGPQGVDEETMYHELDHVWQQASGPVAGTDNGMGAKVSSPRDAFEVSSAANGRRVARGEAPDLTLPGGHGHGTHVQRAAAAPAVQRMENPRGRRDERGYEADASGPEQDSDSSPERRELQERIRREMEEGPNLDDLAERLDRLAERPAIPRFRRVLPESDSDSSEPAPEPPARIRLPAAEPMPTLAEHTDLAPLRELLMQDLEERDLDKKLKVTFNVLATGNVLGGHAWLEVTGSTGQRVSFGFFPERGVQFVGLGSVRGGVRCPDPFVGRYEPTLHESKNVTLRDVVKGYEMVHGRTQNDYNFTQHNCTTFAGDVWKAMTGKTLPNNYLTALGLLSLAVATPQAAADGLGSRQEQRTNARRERALPLAQGPVRGLMPGAGTAEEVAERIARERQSQSSSSESTEEVD